MLHCHKLVLAGTNSKFFCIAEASLPVGIRVDDFEFVFWCCVMN